ncbi:hypothetical protein MSMEI_2689 [Mycolicibacterium smegmatis MC2 155]|uniref:Uncharacterized protein n=2 Tax=Mycolicibacterium smegmatis (strain ATCC 700084 / mc(2)155) TaxID=246196 RepID=I7G0L3_MYCS2|nr:hypothetical protein MSMEG_2759 [Mycolicibacterium smegmatis MC2 155]AFP39157.1 hypothetical protein MSMEI_2689 [Mycolicibacterium smegmatis MC2 155]
MSQQRCAAHRAWLLVVSEDARREHTDGGPEMSGPPSSQEFF